MSSSSSVWAEVPLISAATDAGAFSRRPMMRLGPPDGSSPAINAKAGTPGEPPSVTPSQSAKARRAAASSGASSG